MLLLFASAFTFALALALRQHYHDVDDARCARMRAAEVTVLVEEIESVIGGRLSLTLLRQSVRLWSTQPPSMVASLSSYKHISRQHYSSTH